MLSIFLITLLTPSTSMARSLSEIQHQICKDLFFETVLELEQSDLGLKEATSPPKRTKPVNTIGRSSTEDAKDRVLGLTYTLLAAIRTSTIILLNQESDEQLLTEAERIQESCRMNTTPGTCNYTLQNLFSFLSKTENLSDFKSQLSYFSENRDKITRQFGLLANGCESSVTYSLKEHSVECKGDHEFSKRRDEMIESCSRQENFWDSSFEGESLKVKISPQTI